MNYFKLLLQSFDQSQKRHSFLKKGDRVLLALSGGPDSTAMAMVFSALKSKLNLHLEAAYLDHGIDKRFSSKSRIRVSRLCTNLDIKLHIKRCPIKKIAKKNKQSLEDTGRKQRYAFFERVCKSRHLNTISTAHTLDDQAETVLLRILRGSGLRGLGSIAPLRWIGRVKLIRPFVNTPKYLILDMLKSQRVLFVTDPSNSSFDFLRSKVRTLLMPVLKKQFNPQIEASLVDLSETSLSAYTFIEESAKKELKKCMLFKKASIKIKLKSYLANDAAIMAEMFFLAVSHVIGSRLNIGRHHYDQFLNIAKSQQPNLTLYLPMGIKLVKNGSLITLSKVDD